MKFPAIVLNLVICIIFCHQNGVAGFRTCYVCYKDCATDIKAMMCQERKDKKPMSCLTQKDANYEFKTCVLSDYKTECEILNNEEDITCEMCDTDLCNTGTTYLISVFLLSIVFFLLICS